MTDEELRSACMERIDYNAETGIARWKRTKRHDLIGEQVGVITLGYRRVKLFGRMYMLHRLIFLMQVGRMPNLIDHIDGDGLNNKWSNLREADYLLNSQNIKKAKSNNKSGFLGCHSSQPGLYEARIRHEGKQHKIGYFKTPEEAHKAYVEAKRKLHVGNTL